MIPLFPKKRVTKRELQLIFNHLQFYDRVRSGELTAEVKSENHPCPVEAGQPPCTWTQIVSYFDADNQEVARVHQYKLPNGSIGASGLPDPVRLLVDGCIYCQKRKTEMN
jgi:hypothetical protein